MDKNKIESLIERLNKQEKVVSELNKKSEAERARKKVLEEQFLGAVDEYEKKYGVKIQGKTLEATLTNFEKELESVFSSLEKELDEQLKIIKAIQSGDIDGANALITGVGLETETVESETEKVESGVNEGSEFIPVEDAFADWDAGDSDEEYSEAGVEIESDDSFSLDEDDDDDVEFDIDDDEDFGSLLSGTKFSL